MNSKASKFVPPTLLGLTVIYNHVLHNPLSFENSSKTPTPQKHHSDAFEGWRKVLMNSLRSIQGGFY